MDNFKIGPFSYFVAVITLGLISQLALGQSRPEIRSAAEKKVQALIETAQANQGL